MNPTNKNDEACEPFEPMVSAMIDGELSLEEQTSLSRHLNDCGACQQLLREFECVNDAVDSLAPADTFDRTMLHTETFVVTRKRQSVRNWISVWRLVPLAAVAALMIGLFLVTTQPAQNAKADQLSPEQFYQPLADLNRINHQQQRDQEMMLRTLGMDLRTLKLELMQLDNAGPEDRTRFEKQIEAMLKRIQQFESNEA